MAVLVAAKTVGDTKTQVNQTQALLKIIANIICGLIGYMTLAKGASMEELGKRISVILLSNLQGILESIVARLLVRRGRLAIMNGV